MKITTDTKWRLIEWGVYVVFALIGAAVIGFAVSALYVTWKYTHHEFFWWTIPQLIVATIVTVLGLLVVLAPHALVRLDERFRYHK